MSTNRLYIIDDETGETVLLATGMGHWSLWKPEKVDQFLREHDIACAVRFQDAKSTLRLVTEDDLPRNKEEKP